MRYKVEQIFSDLKHTCLGWSYQNFDTALKGLIYGMRDKIGHPFIGEQFRNLRFFMNLPFYHEFSIACQMAGKSSEWCRGIKIIQDPTLYIGNTQSPDGIVRLVYEEPVHNDYMNCLRYCINRFETKEENKMPPKDGNTGTFYFDDFIKPFFSLGAVSLPHIDHVIFNDPATIVFWKDGTKTVVKCQEGDNFDHEKGLAMCIAKKTIGLKEFYKAFNPAFDKWLQDLTIEEAIK